MPRTRRNTSTTQDTTDNSRNSSRKTRSSSSKATASNAASGAGRPAVQKETKTRPAKAAASKGKKLRKSAGATAPAQPSAAGALPPNTHLPPHLATSGRPDSVGSGFVPPSFVPDGHDDGLASPTGVSTALDTGMQGRLLNTGAVRGSQGGAVNGSTLHGSLDFGARVHPSQLDAFNAGALACVSNAGARGHPLNSSVAPGGTPAGATVRMYDGRLDGAVLGGNIHAGLNTGSFGHTPVDPGARSRVVNASLYNGELNANMSRAIAHSGDGYDMGALPGTANARSHGDAHHGGTSRGFARASMSGGVTPPGALLPWGPPPGMAADDAPPPLDAEMRSPSIDPLLLSQRVDANFVNANGVPFEMNLAEHQPGPANIEQAPPARTPSSHVRRGGRPPRTEVHAAMAQRRDPEPQPALSPEALAAAQAALAAVGAPAGAFANLLPTVQAAIALAQAPELIPKPPGEHGRKTNPLTGKVGYNAQVELRIPDRVWNAAEGMVHLLSFQAPLDFSKLYNKQEEVKLDWICQQMNVLFAKTRLARCEKDWGTRDLIKQFVGNHRRRITSLRRQYDAAVSDAQEQHGDALWEQDPDTMACTRRQRARQQAPAMDVDDAAEAADAEEDAADVEEDEDDADQEDADVADGDEDEDGTDSEDEHVAAEGDEDADAAESDVAADRGDAAVESDAEAEERSSSSALSSATSSEDEEEVKGPRRRLRRTNA